MLKVIFHHMCTPKFKLNARLLYTTNVCCSKISKPNLIDTENFTPVYKFRYIREISLINRLKLYQTVFTAVAIPCSVILSLCNIVNLEVVISTSLIGLGGCAFFHTIGIFTDKFIGIVYLNKEEKIVRVAYLDFWGLRKDIEIPLDDIVPLSDIPSAFTDKMYLRFTRFSSTKHLKINLPGGNILDNEKFKKIFALK